MIPAKNIQDKAKLAAKSAGGPVKGDEKEIKRSLHYSNIEGVFNSASASIYNSFLIPFALFLKATNPEIGLLTSIQNLAHTLSQIPGAILTEHYSRKSIWMVSQVFGKVLFWSPMLVLPLIQTRDAILYLIILAALTTFMTGLRLPAWTSLIGDLVPANIRGRYFGERNMLLGIAGILMTAAGGYIITSYGFSTLFIVYIFLSILAIPFFLKMHEPPTKKVFHYRHRIDINPSHWKSALNANRSLVIFTVYLVAMNFAVMMAAPFYIVYTIKDLGIDYATFAVLVTLGAAARIVSFRYWGRLSDKFGSRKILIVCAFFGVFTPFLWLFVSDAFTIALVNIFDGLIWSGFDLVAFNYLLDITPADRRPQYVANHNFFVGIGVVVGALAGGVLAAYFESNTLWVFTGLQAVFLLSFLVRIAFLVILPKIPEADIRQSAVVPVQYVFWQAVAVEPMRGLANAVHYTFRYPYEIEKEFSREISRIKYRIKMMRT